MKRSYTNRDQTLCGSSNRQRGAANILGANKGKAQRKKTPGRPPKTQKGRPRGVGSPAPQNREAWGRSAEKFPEKKKGNPERLKRGRGNPTEMKTPRHNRGGRLLFPGWRAGKNQQGAAKHESMGINTGAGTSNPEKRTQLKWGNLGTSTSQKMDGCHADQAENRWSTPKERFSSSRFAAGEKAAARGGPGRLGRDASARSLHSTTDWTKARTHQQKTNSAKGG